MCVYIYIYIYNLFVCIYDTHIIYIYISYTYNYYKSVKTRVSLLWKIIFLWPSTMFTYTFLVNFIIKYHHLPHIHFTHSTFPHKHHRFSNMRILLCQYQRSQCPKNTGVAGFSLPHSNVCQCPTPRPSCAV